MSVTSTSGLLLVGIPAGAAKPGVATLPAGVTPWRALDLADAVDSHLAAGPGLVLVHEDRPPGDAGSAPMRHQVALLRAALHRDEALVRLVPGPVTRTLLLARLLAESGAAVGDAASLVDPVLQGMRTYALLGSVAHLESPAPTLGQHARGLAPGGCFLVDDRSVTAVKGRLPRGLGRGPTAALAVGAAVAASSDWPERLWLALGPGAEVPQPVAAPGKQTWGTGRWAEITVSDLTAEQVAAGIAATPHESCSWCSRSVLADLPCPFCGAAASGPRPTRPEESR